MEIALHIGASVLLFISSLIGGGDGTTPQPTSSEIGIYEVSPKGEEGGVAVPASGCGVVHGGLPVHSCSSSAPDITVNKPIIRSGDPVTVSWDPKTNTNCALSSSVTSLVGSPNPTAATDPDEVGSRVDTPTGEKTYSIACDGAGNTDTVTVKVLPRIQET